MKTEMKSFLASIELGPAQTHENVTVFPLICPGNGAVYTTLAEALKNQTLVVTEVSQAGSVPELKVINKGDQPVLLIDGEELIGAKQNRVLNTSVLLKEHSEVLIPVSCTEQGRWSYASPSFSSSDVVMAHKSRARKARSVSESLACYREYLSDQGEVWEGISELHAKAQTHSPTSAMNDVFQAKHADLESCLKTFTLVAGQNGLLVVIDGEVAGFDLVSRPDAYGKLHPKLLKSYLIEALVERRKAKVDAGKARDLALAFLKEAAECEQSEFRSIGYGTDLRFKKPMMAGTALWHKQVIHSAFFRLAAEDEGGKMASLRKRRRFIVE